MDIVIEICQIDEIHPHPNADRMELAIIKGYTSAIPLERYKAGDSVVFVPPEAMLPQEFIDRHAITYLKNKHGRVGVVKLRGVYSEGIVLDNLDGYKVGKNVAKEYGITKWVEKEAKMRTGLHSGQERSWKQQNPHFPKYTDLRHYKDFVKVLIHREPVIITEKIHGCVPYFTPITMADGSNKKICQINTGDEVMGMDINGDVIATPVLRTFKNGLTDEWVYLKGKRVGLGWGGDPRISLPLTSNHPVWVPGKNRYIEAIKIKANDKVLMIRNNIQLTPIQKQILIGKMLGDGHLAIIKYSASMFISHKKDHKDYLEWCMSALGDIGSNYRDSAMSGYGTIMVRARSVSLYHIKEYFKNWYKDNKIIIPRQLVQDITPLGLAVWYMDDGSLGSCRNQENTANFASCSFSKKDHVILLECLNKFNIKGNYYKDSQGYGRIRLNADDAEMLFLLIAPYIPKVMQYKLPKRHRSGREPWLPSYNNNYKQIKVLQTITDIKIVPAKKGDRVKHNIETGTNNYFANKVLVSNSNFRAGRVRRPLPANIWIKFKEWFQRQIIGSLPDFVPIYGSHNVQLRFKKEFKGHFSSNIYLEAYDKYKLEDILDDGIIVFGEIYGPGIQNRYNYGITTKQCLFYEVMIDKTFMDPEIGLEYLKALGLPTVPVLYSGPWDPKLIKELAIGKSSLDSDTIREGIVITAVNQREVPGVGRPIFRCISPEYLAQKDRTEHK